MSFAGIGRFFPCQQDRAIEIPSLGVLGRQFHGLCKRLLRLGQVFGLVGDVTRLCFIEVDLQRFVCVVHVGTLHSWKFF